MASKKERLEKKRNALNEKKLAEQKERIIEPEQEETAEEKEWVRPASMEEISFLHEGRNHRTYYRLTLMHKNSKGIVHQYRLGRKQLSVFLGSFIILIATICSVLVFKEYRRANQLEEAMNVIASLQGQVGLDKQNADAMQHQIDELTEQNSILSETLNNKNEVLNVYLEAERLEHLPTAYPLRGSSTYYVPETNEEDEYGNREEDNENGDNENDETLEPGPEESTGDLWIKFVTGMGSSVVATATGEVSEVSLEEDGSYTIAIDHGNGYVTLYSGMGTIMVKEGDCVTEGTLLLAIMENETIITYQIFLNGTLVDPWECMEING